MDEAMKLTERAQRIVDDVRIGSGSAAGIRSSISGAAITKWQSWSFDIIRVAEGAR